MSTSGTVKIATVVFVFFGFLSSCKKNEHENIPPVQHGCRVSYFTTNVRDTSFISYNSNGSVNNIRD